MSVVSLDLERSKRKPAPERKLWFQDSLLVTVRRMNKEDAEDHVRWLYESDAITRSRALRLLEFHVGAVARFERRFPADPADAEQTP